jgi:hypothetical protein
MQLGWIETISDSPCMRTELARYFADPEHHGVLRDDIGGDQELLQKVEGVRFDEEAYIVRPIAHITPLAERFRAIESEIKRVAFALVDKEDALSKAKRDPSKSLVSLVQRTTQAPAHKSSSR